ncbi:MAG: DUF3892 domain-containing protein [Gammaproteobacteria bacterium]|nr:DUF3892 domain-containing protein [Gammaproteobacteria bacterium]
MATAFQVTCIKRDKPSLLGIRKGPISHIGGVSNGLIWRHTTQEAINNILHGYYSYFVEVNSTIAKVEVATNNGIMYLKTNKDGHLTDNLSSLPECP